MAWEDLFVFSLANFLILFPNHFLMQTTAQENSEDLPFAQLHDRWFGLMLLQSSLQV